MVFQIDDEVVSLVNHPESNTVIKKGDIGRVASISMNGAILVDWRVKPDAKYFHDGNLHDYKLPQPTGWWIYGPNQIARIDDDEPIVHPSTDELDTLFA